MINGAFLRKDYRTILLNHTYKKEHLFKEVYSLKIILQNYPSIRLAHSLCAVH